MTSTARTPRPQPTQHHNIPHLPNSDVASSLLRRIENEFLPIARRRGWNVLSISEMCCCGDGLDARRDRGNLGRGGGGRGRRRRPAPSNVWGYNMTTFGGGGVGVGGRGGGGRRKSHRIHLRLRDPTDHSVVLPYEDVAGTMSHELAHCGVGPHSAEFYRLMEE